MNIIDIKQESGRTDAKVTFAVNSIELPTIVGNLQNNKTDFIAVEEGDYHELCKIIREMEKGIKKADNGIKKADNGIKIIFNPPATILITPDGKKYVSKAHNEEFDEEKGLLMCLAKANGFTHLTIKKMIKNANRPKKEN